MTYFEQALHFFEAGKLEEARKYFGYAKNFGSENEKQRATDILEQIDAGTVNVDSLVHENMLARPVKTLLEEKRYGLALEKLLALGDSASAEELYYLGVLHEDFGMGMPNDLEKARAYFKKSFELGYADAGVGYVYVEAPDLLSTEQRKLLEKAEKRGSIRAKVALLLDDVLSASEEELEATRQRYEQFLEKTKSDNPHVLFFQAVENLSKNAPVKRACGFEMLLCLRNCWDTNIACLAWLFLGECFRDGHYVPQDLDEAKFCFNKIVKIGMKKVPEGVREFLSGNWKDEPSKDEDAKEWAVGKLGEKYRQIEEALFFAHQTWLYELGESNKEECNVGELSHIFSKWTDIIGVLKTVKNLIKDLAKLLKTHFEISDATEILNQKIKKEFAVLKKIIEEMDADLVNYTADADSDGLLSSSEIAKKHMQRFLEAKEAFIETLKNTLASLISQEENEKKEFNIDDFDSLFSSLKSSMNRGIAFKIKDLLFAAYVSWKMRMTDKKVSADSFEIPDSWKEDSPLAFKKMIEDWNADCFRKEIKEIINSDDIRSHIGKELKSLYQVLKEMQHALHERQTVGADEFAGNLSEIEARFSVVYKDFLEVMEQELREDDYLYEEYEDDEEDEECDDDAYVFCTSCGTRNPEGANFCYKCGEEIFKDED